MKLFQIKVCLQTTHFNVCYSQITPYIKKAIWNTMLELSRRKKVHIASQQICNNIQHFFSCTIVEKSTINLPMYTPGTCEELDAYSVITLGCV